MKTWPNSNPETRRKAGLPPQPELINSDPRVPKQYNPRVATILKEWRRSQETKGNQDQ